MSCADKNDEYEELVYTFSDMVTRICYLRLNHIQDAEDCYQNVFLKLYFNDIKERPLGEIKKWLIATTVNECIDLRRRLFHRNHADIDKLIIPAAEQMDFELVKYLKKLPGKYALVLYLYYYEGYKIREISEVLDIKENTVKTIMSRAKKAMKGVLLKDGYERF